MKKKILFYIISVIFQTSYSQSPIELIQKMIDEEAKIKSLKLTMVMNERIDGKMSKSKSDFMISYSPFQLYMKQEIPIEGMEILYSENKNNNKAWVNTNSFPWVTLSIDPNSNLMRKDYHHSIFDSGYRNFSNIVRYLINKNYNKVDEILSYNGIKTINGYQCHQIMYTSPSFEYFNYITKNEITLTELAKKFYVNDYMLIEKNPGLIDFDEVKTNKNLKIPSDYGKKVIINLDIKNHLPRSIHIYDEKGLYEEYYYTNVMINPPLVENDFNPDNKKYNF